MDWLSDKLPTSVMVSGEEYQIDTDFRNCLKIIQAFESQELTQLEKFEVLFNRLYEKEPNFFQDNLIEAAEKGVKFLDCGGAVDGTSTGARLYSFEQDGMYIRSAIEKTHQIRLEQIEHLHWWEFVYMFIDLDDSTFTEMRRLRYNHHAGKLTKDERKYLQKHPEILLEAKTNTEQQVFEDDILARARAKPVRKEAAHES